MHKEWSDFRYRLDIEIVWLQHNVHVKQIFFSGKTLRQLELVFHQNSISQF